MLVMVAVVVMLFWCLNICVQQLCKTFTIVRMPMHLFISKVLFWSRCKKETKGDWHIQVYLVTHTHTRLTALFPGLPRWAGTRKVKPIWILLKQETVSGSCISWAVCMSAPHSRQTTTPTPHHSVFYRPVALPAAQPTASKHWRQ